MASLTQLAAILAAVLIGEFPTCLGKSFLQTFSSKQIGTKGAQYPIGLVHALNVQYCSSCHWVRYVM